MVATNVSIHNQSTITPNVAIYYIWLLIFNTLIFVFHY
jgi:hypothetical protein